MFTRRIPALCAALILSLAAGAFAQAQAAPSADQQAMIQQMQQSFQTIMQNMQAKGIDPQTFFQQMQNGADPADIQQQLVDKGIIDQKTIDQLQGTMQRFAMTSIKQEMQVGSDDEWNAIQPLVQKAMTAAAELNRGRPGAAAGFMPAQAGAQSDVAKAVRDLRAALKDPGTPNDQIASLLKTLRDARDRARADLNEAQNNLKSVLTVRQEGVLLFYGILE